MKHLVKRVSLAIALAILAVTATPLAQSKPNFSGKWTVIPSSIAPEPRGNGIGGTGGFGESFTIVQDDKTLTVQSTYVMGDKSTAVYALDGSETKNPMTTRGMTADRVSRTKWKGASLEISTTMTLMGRSVPMVQTLSLEASGNLVIEATTTFDGVRTSKASFKKN